MARSSEPSAPGRSNSPWSDRTPPRGVTMSPWACPPRGRLLRAASPSTSARHTRMGGSPAAVGMTRSSFSTGTTGFVRQLEAVAADGEVAPASAAAARGTAEVADGVVDESAAPRGAAGDASRPRIAWVCWRCRSLAAAGDVTRARIAAPSPACARATSGSTASCDGTCTPRRSGAALLTTQRAQPAVHAQSASL